MLIFFTNLIIKLVCDALQRRTRALKPALRSCPRDAGYATGKTYLNTERRGRIVLEKRMRSPLSEGFYSGFIPIREI